MMTVEYGKPYWHPTQRCNNCNGRIAVVPKSVGAWGGPIPLGDDLYCPNGCPSFLAGVSGW